MCMCSKPLLHPPMAKHASTNRTTAMHAHSAVSANIDGVLAPFSLANILPVLLSHNVHCVVPWADHHAMPIVHTSRARVMMYASSGMCHARMRDAVWESFAAARAVKILAWPWRVCFDESLG